MRDLVVREADLYHVHVVDVLKTLPGDADFISAMEETEADDESALERCTCVVEAWKEKVRCFEHIVNTLHLQLTYAAIRHHCHWHRHWHLSRATTKCRWD